MTRTEQKTLPFEHRKTVRESSRCASGKHPNNEPAQYTSEVLNYGQRRSLRKLCGRHSSLSNITCHARHLGRSSSRTLFARECQPFSFKTHARGLQFNLFEFCPHLLPLNVFAQLS